MYILCDKRTKGVYAVEDELKNKVVQIFVDKDDALRYYGLLEANDYKRDLMITDIDEESVIANCEAHNYRYAFIDPDELVVPPL